jgi:DHA2 family multidrug resistance protein
MSEQVVPPPPMPTPVGRDTWLASIAAFSAAWMVVMATRYFALQAADVNGGLGVGVDAGSWVSTAYAICEPIGVVFGAWLGIVLSLRRMLLGSVMVFLAGMCIAWVAPGYGTLMASRIVAGLAAGAIMPQCIVVQLQCWGAARTPVAIALYLSASTAGLQFGGVAGAWGVEHFGWTFILWASMPLGILSLATGWIGCRRDGYSWRPLIHADVAGFVSLCASLGLFACALSQGDRMRWFQTPAIPVMFMASAACLAIFAFRNWRRIRHPALWVKLYGRWNIALTATGVLSLTLAISMSGVIVPGVLAQVQGFRPEQVAPALWAAVWPQALSYALGVWILRRKLCDVRVLVILGFATVAIGALLNLQLTSQWQVGQLYPGQLVQAIGLPMIALPLVYHFTGDLRPPVEALPAAGVFNLSRVLGGTIATAWASTSLRVDSQSRFAELLGSTGLDRAVPPDAVTAIAGRLSHTTSDAVLARAQAVQVVATAARRQAVVLGATSTLTTLACLLFASCILVVLMEEFGWGKALRPHEKRP